MTKEETKMRRLRTRIRKNKHDTAAIRMLQDMERRKKKEDSGCSAQERLMRAKYPNLYAAGKIGVR